MINFFCREKIVYIVADSQHSESLFVRYFQPFNPLLYRSFALLIVITGTRWLVARPQSLSPPCYIFYRGCRFSTANVVIQAGVLGGPLVTFNPFTRFAQKPVMIG